MLKFGAKLLNSVTLIYDIYHKLGVFNIFYDKVIELDFNPIIGIPTKRDRLNLLDSLILCIGELLGVGLIVELFHLLSHRDPSRGVLTWRFLERV